MSLLDKIRAEVSKLTPEEVKAELLKIKEKQARQVEYRQGKGLTEEQKAKRAEYNKKRMADPAVKAKQKEYRMKPENVEKRKAYQAERNAKQKEILARAKELGITAD